MSLSYVSTDFHQTISKLRQFFLKKGYMEVHVQDRLSILAACEDPTNITPFSFGGEIWPLPQTGQMWLEDELLKTPSVEGVFCITTSYRLEKNPIPGRHNLIFPMFEFESKGTLDDLIALEKELCAYLGFGDEGSFPEVFYTDAMKRYGVEEITATEEEQLCQDYNSLVFLKNFPMSTSPFWNMRLDPITGTAKKVDVIIHGLETIGSAERECDAQGMYDRFHSISDGQYAHLLISRFGKERVTRELDAYLSHNFFPRFGAGIGVTRLIKGLKAHNLLLSESYKIAV